MYTMTTSEGFTGTSEQRSGSKLTCKVTLDVPRKCEVIMKLTECNIQGFDSFTGAYRYTDDAEFVQLLESYFLYFQINEGLVVEDTIVADVHETEDVLNIKRGIVSALQLDYHFPNEFGEQQSIKEVQKEISDIFGTCPTTYVHDKDNINEVTTLRVLNECKLRHIAIAQLPKFGSTTLRSVSGSVKKELLNEGKDLFDMRVFCKQTFKDKETLELATCTQQQFFKPTAFADEHQTIYAMMVNVTQRLELDDAIRKGQQEPNRNLNGRKIIDFGFDFGDQSDNVEIADLQKAMEDLKQTYEQNDVENIPDSFEDVVIVMRKSSLTVLHDLMIDVFSCGQECDAGEIAMRTFYLDGLKSCGTENCHLQLFECIQHEGHMDKFSASEFLYGLGEIDHVSQDVQLKMLDYCKSSGSMRCWLPLGTVLSKTEETGEKLPADSPMGQTYAYIKEEFSKHCGAETLEVTPRHLLTAAKVLGNIGLQKIRSSLTEDVDLHAIFNKCLVNKVIPDSVVYVILQEIQEDHRILGYKGMPGDVVEDLFGLFDDDSRHNNLRTMTFSVLAKTSDEAVLQRLSERISRKDSYNEQLKVYMVNFINLMYENDQPDMQLVREAWKNQPEPPYISHRKNPFFSKPLYFGDFFKVPFSEYFGGVLYMDLIYDPTSIHVSSVSVQLNYYYESKRYNVFEFTWNMHGIDQLYAALNVKPEEAPSRFMTLLQGGMGKNPDGEDNFLKFQQDIVEKVMKLLAKVNFPKFPDFDIYFDLKKQGQSFMFISLQEVLALMRGMAQQNPRAQQEFLQRLLQGIDKDAFKATEFVSLYRVLPTVAGIPMNMRATLTGWNRIKSNIKSNLLLLMGKQATDITMGLKQFVLFNNEFRSRTELPIGNVHTSGVGFRLKLGSERDGEVDVKYGKTEDGSKKFHLNLSPISKDRSSETLMYARGRQYLVNDGTDHKVMEDATVQSTYKRCLNDMFQMALGRSMCVVFTYPKVGTSPKHPYFPMSGPFDMDVVMEKVDSVEVYNLVIDYTNSKELFQILLQHTGQGTTLSRYSTIDISFDKTSRRMELLAVSAEFGIEYKYVLDTYGRDFELSEFLTMKGEDIFGYRIKAVENKAERSVNLNMKFAQSMIFWEMDIISPRYHRTPEDRLKIVFTYYCSQLRPFLYLLHLSPLHAMNNDDRSVVTFEYYKDKTVYDQTTYYISLELLDVKLETTYVDEQHTYQIIPKYIIIDEGTTRELSAHFTLVKDENKLGGPVIHGTVILDGTEFGLSSTGTLEADMQSFVFTSEVTYDKDMVSKELSRKKRWTEQIFGRLQALEEEVVDRFYQMEESILGKRSVDSQIDSSSEKFLSSVIPTFPSIWDQPSWTSHFEIKGTLSQVPATDGFPPSMKLVLEESFLHPWNGGYRHFQHTQEMGMGGQNNFRNFKYWASGEMNMTYTNFDGTPTIDTNGEPMKTIRFGEIHVYRQAGNFFDFGVHHNGPLLQMKYEILFDWDAASHHEPLVRVVSDYQNTVLPYFNHNYEEKFSMEDGHWMHFLEFQHKLIEYEVTSDLLFNSDRLFKATEMTINQKGSIGFHSSDQDQIYTFTAASSNLIKKHILDLEYTIEYEDSTNPDKVHVYSYYLKERLFGVRVGKKTSQAAVEVVPLWEYKYDLLETMVKVTITWEPHADEVMREAINSYNMYPGLLLKTYGQKIKNDFRLPFMRQPIFLTSVSLHDLSAAYIKPNVMKGLVYYNNFMANFVPKEQRQGDKGTLNPRLNMLMEAMKNYKDQDPSYMGLMIQRLNYFTVSGLGNVLLMQGARIQKSPWRAQVFEERKLEYACTYSFIVRYKNQFHYIDWRESDDHVWRALRNLRHTPPKTVNSNYGAIFKQRDKDTGLNILTFGGHIHEIPVSETSHGTYLLAADMIHGQYYLVSTPNGITLIGKQCAVSIGFDDEIFTDDSIIPSSDTRQVLGEGEIVWKRSGTEIHVETAFGIYITCDMSYSKACFIGLDKLYRNTTIGLLGTNNGDAVTDQRGLQGQTIQDTSNLLSEYCLDGCENVPHKPGPTEECLAQGKAVCEDESSTRYWYRYYTCRYTLRMTREQVKGLMCNGNTGCSMDPYSTCVLVRTLVNLCQSEGLIHPQEKLVLCDRVPNKHLEMVFVLPVKGFASTYQVQPVDHMIAIVDKNLQVWSCYHTTRFGAVGFNGDMENGNPFVMHGKSGPQDRYFFDMAELVITEFMDYVKADDVEKIDKGTNSFKAIQMAAEYPFDIATDKFIVLVTTKTQSEIPYSDLESLKAELLAKKITLVVFYKEFEFNDYKVIGLDFKGKAITFNKERVLSTPIQLPRTDLTELVEATKGSIWNLKGISHNDSAVIMEHLINQRNRNRYL